jgi:D-alanyl-D-alanine carboxypeptidase
MSLVFERRPQPSYDARVAFFQLLLDLPSAAVDGLFGAATEAKVMEFQGREGLPVDGRVAEQTGRRLRLPYWDAQTVRADLAVPFRDPNQFAEGHEFVFRSEIQEGGHFSSQPERFVPGTVNKGTVRALRTNNPGALNISRWQKSLSGYTGETLDDGHGNRTTIYETPEKGVGAWYELVVVLYSRKPGYLQNGTFSLGRLARAYAGVPLDTPDGDPAVQGYLAGWGKWSARIPDSQLQTSVIDPTSTDQLRRLAIAMFSHESSFATPLIASQVEKGIQQAEQIAAAHRRSDAKPTGEAGAGLFRNLSLGQLLRAEVAGGELAIQMALEEERVNGEQRRKRMLDVLNWEARGVDVNEAAEN